jgi:glycosyltransferase involved in cell wall biosynthesis
VEEERVRSEITATGPRVSIGLPVYNGENYLADTLDSILTQTFHDFELIISDNASSDATEAICRKYAERDPRIRYVRNAENLGAAKNYNRAFQLARGAYFKWNGHDDPLAPTFLERCVEVLDRDPEIVLAFARIRAIDAGGEEHELGALTARTFAPRPQLGSAQAHVRFYHTVVADHPQGAIFGLIRRNVLARTPLIGSYRSSDLPLLGELALHGRFHQIPEILQDRRFHPQQGRYIYNTKQLREEWFDPSRSHKRTHPHLRLLQEHVNAIRRAAPDSRSRTLCYGYMAMWVIKYVCVRAPLKVILRRPYRFIRSTGAPDRVARLLSRYIGM